MFKSFAEEVKAAEAKVKGLLVIGAVRRFEHSNAVYKWEDCDMDTTETLYMDNGGKYSIRVEEYHEFMSADNVYSISRAEADKWTRENARRMFTPAHKRTRQIMAASGKSRAYRFWKGVAKVWRKKGAQK